MRQPCSPATRASFRRRRACDGRNARRSTTIPGLRWRAAIPVGGVHAGRGRAHRGGDHAHDSAVGFDDDDALLMRTVAEQLAAALRGASLRDESERRARRLALTLEVAKPVATAATPVDDAALGRRGDRHAHRLRRAWRRSWRSARPRSRCRSWTSTARQQHRGHAPVDGRGHDRRAFETGGSWCWATGGRRVRPLAGERIGVRVGADHAGGRGRALRRRAGPVRHHHRPFDAEDALLMETVAEQVAAALRGARCAISPRAAHAGWRRWSAASASCWRGSCARRSRSARRWRATCTTTRCRCSRRA